MTLGNSASWTDADLDSMRRERGEVADRVA
jgi:hypothetical protein